ncbi:unnamed protein product, partial [Tetraodon nigroviridis]
IDKLKGDLSRKHELNLKEELQNAKLGPIQDEMVKILAAEKEKVAEKESELEKLRLDKQNHVLQQKHLQIRLKQLEEQLLQKDRELQELREKQEGWEKQRRETENKNKWKRFFRRREASNENSPEKEQQTRYSPLFRLLLSWKSWKMVSDTLVCLGNRLEGPSRTAARGIGVKGEAVQNVDEGKEVSNARRQERPKVSQLANGSECDPPIRTEETKINIQLVHTLRRPKQ